MEKIEKSEPIMSENLCKSLLVESVYPQNKLCPKCGSSMTLLEDRPAFSCAQCKAQETIRKGLFLEGGKLPLSVWFHGVALLYTERSLSDTALSKALGIHRPSAKRIKEQVLPVLADLEEPTPNTALVRAILKAVEQGERLVYHTVTPQYRIVHEDSYTELPKISDKSVNLIIADVPYDMRIAEWDGAVDFKALAEQFSRIITDDGNVIVFLSPEQFGSCYDAFIKSKFFKHHQQFIYEKTNPTHLHVKNRRLASAVENALVFWKDSATHTYNATGGEKNTFTCSKASPKERERCGGHETPKPIVLMEHLVKIYSNEGNLVLDAFMGSGSTGEAALTLGRKFLGIERELRYCESSAKRLKSCYKRRMKTAKSVDAMAIAKVEKVAETTEVAKITETMNVTESIVLLEEDWGVITNFYTEDSPIIKRRFEEIKNFFKANYQENNSVFITLTYSPKNLNPYSIENDVSEFISRFEKRVGEKITWLYLLEPYRTDGWHVHMIVFFQKDTAIPSEYEQYVGDLWVHGETHYKKVFNEEIITYLTKSKWRFHKYPTDLKFTHTSSKKI